MSIIDRILEHSRNARVPRARDPETHEPIPYGEDQPAVVRVGAWILKTSWWERFWLKWSGTINTAMTAWLLTRGTGEHTAAIVTGAMAVMSFAYEQLASYLTSKATMKIPPAIGAPTAEQEQESIDAWDARPSIFKPLAPPTTSSSTTSTVTVNAMAPTQRINLPTQAELDATRAKLHGFSVEVEGEVHDFIDKQAAFAFHQLARSEGQRSTLLF